MGIGQQKPSKMTQVKQDATQARLAMLDLPDGAAWATEARAAAVSTFLTNEGISDDRLSAVGLGKAQPRVADEFDPENRRVELRIDLR